MKFIDRAKSHFESLGVQHIEVEEWKDEAGNPSVIYWNPITLSEKNKLFKKSDNLNDVSILADILVMKAVDKDGNKLFTLEDKIALMHKTDSDVLSRIATAMVQVITPDEVKKNPNKTLNKEFNYWGLSNEFRARSGNAIRHEFWEIIRGN